MKNIAARVVKVKQKAKPAGKPRLGRKDVKKPMRNDVTLRAEELPRGCCLTRSSFAQLNEDFPDQNLKRNLVGKQVKWYREQKSEGIPLTRIDWSRKRKHCGRDCYKFTAAVAQKLININNKY